MLLVDVVLVLVVNVDEGPFDVLKPFQLALKFLIDIMGDLERRLLVHDDVNFDIVLLASVVGAAL